MKPFLLVTILDLLSFLSPIVSKTAIVTTAVSTIISTFTITNYQNAVLAKPLSSGSSGGSSSSSSPSSLPPNTALISLRQNGLIQDFTFPVPIPAAKSHTTVTFSYLSGRYRSLLTKNFDAASVIRGPPGFQCFLSSYSSADFGTPPRPSPPFPLDESYFSSIPSFLRQGRRPPSPFFSASSTASPSPQDPPGLRVSPTFSQGNPWPRSTYIHDAEEITCFIVENINTLVAWTVNQSDDNEDDATSLPTSSSRSSDDISPTTEIIFINIGSESGGIAFPKLRNVLAAALVSAPSDTAECILVNTGAAALMFSQGVPCTGTLGFQSIGIQCVREFQEIEVTSVEDLD